MVNHCLAPSWYRGSNLSHGNNEWRVHPWISPLQAVEASARMSSWYFQLQNLGLKIWILFEALNSFQIWTLFSVYLYNGIGTCININCIEIPFPSLQWTSRVHVDIAWLVGFVCWEMRTKWIMFLTIMPQIVLGKMFQLHILAFSEDLSCSMTKPTKWLLPAKTQISLGVLPVWSDALLSTCRKLGSLATHGAHSEDWSDWADVQADLSLLGSCDFVGCVMLWLIYPFEGCSWCWFFKAGQFSQYMYLPCHAYAAFLHTF